VVFRGRTEVPLEAAIVDGSDLNSSFLTTVGFGLSLKPIAPDKMSKAKVFQKCLKEKLLFVKPLETTFPTTFCKAIK
jgi:hypothetical protein